MVFLFLSWVPPAVLASEGAAIHENFANLNDWITLRYDKTKKDTVYSVVDEKGVTCLKAESADSSSAILCKKEFNVYQYPVVIWNWKVSNIYARGNIREKKDNDSPARLYVMFKYDPGEAGFFTKLKYMIAKKVYGRYPPRYALCYVWANRLHKEKIITSPGFGEIKYIVLEAGKGRIGKWRKEEVNVLDDFRKAFGKKPPPTAAVSFMDDSDNTDGKSTAWLSSLEVLKKQIPSVGNGVASSMEGHTVGH